MTPLDKYVAEVPDDKYRLERLLSEYFPKFVKLSLIAHAPAIVATVLMMAC